MSYPRYNRYLIFNRISHDKYNIKNFVTEDEWEMTALYAHFLKKLDGRTNPYDIYSDQIGEEEVDIILEWMEKEELLDKVNRRIEFGLGSISIPLWIPRITRRHRIFGAIWNKILIFIWLPLFIMGVYMLCSNDWKFVSTGHGILKGYFMGIGLGMLLHELSHVFACIGYSSKNHFFEMGIMCRYFLLGAYAIIDYSEMKNRFKRAQIIAAGVECNIALCGLFLCCLKLGVIDSLALIVAAVLNLILAVFNMTLIEGLDGMGIFGEIFTGSDDFVERAKKLVRDKKGKKKLRRRGINGKATIAACYIIVIMQGVLPMMIIINIVSMINNLVM